MSIGCQARTALTDEELVSRYQTTGNAEYFAQIFVRHRRVVFCACRRFFGCSNLAEDATQETFLRAYQGLRRFQHGNVRGWLMRIAKNVCIDTWRKRRPESQLPEVASIDLSDPVNLDHRMEVSRALEKVQEEMKLLAPEQRRCLEMKMEGYSYEETAQRTGLSLEAVKSHLQNGRRMLWLRLQGFLSELP
jgi:RNA polymerase sigma-70 factor (ECF subfamily)